MKSENDKIKDIFSSKLTDFSPDVPADAWDRIVQNLPESAMPIRSNKISLFTKLSAVVGVAAAIILCFILFNPKDESAKQISENLPLTALNPSSPEKNINSTEEVHRFTNPNKGATLIASSSVLPKQIKANISIIPAVIVDKEENNSQTESVDNKSKKSINNNVDEKKTTVNKDDLQAKIKAFENAGKEAEQKLIDNSRKHTTTKEKRGISLSLGGKSGLSKSVDANTYSPNPLAKLGTYSNLEYIDIQTGLQDIKEPPVEMDHKQPISFGVTVSKNIGKGLSLETGLVYTYLSSEVNSKQKSSSYKRGESQNFHYLGLPLALNYDFARWGKADFYVSGGGMIQKDFAGRLKGMQTVDTKDGVNNEGYYKEKISQSHPQLSANATIGASYPIYDKMYVYTTLGGVYYFDADNKYQTVYSDKKIQLDINVGLKFKF